MPFSRIEDIHRAIAAWNISIEKVNDEAVNISTLFLDTLPNFVNNAKLPTRLILPFAGNQQARSMTIYTLGNAQTLVWKLTDLFLYTSVGRGGRGVSDWALPLLRYQVAYMQVLQNNISLNKLATIEDVQCEAAIVNYPQGSEYNYAAVEVVHTIKELVG